MPEASQRAEQDDSSEPDATTEPDQADNPDVASSTDESPPGDRFRHLPRPIRLGDTIATTGADPVQDPDGGRDPERDFMLRYGV
jgi:hypothetical protein